MSTISGGSRSSRVTTTVRYEPGLLLLQGFRDSIEDRFKTMSDFYMLALHQDKMMNAAKHANWPVQLVRLYSGDRGLQLLFAKLLLYIHEECRAQGPLQLSLMWSRDGELNIGSSLALRPGLLFLNYLFDKTEPCIEVFGILFKKAPISILVDGCNSLASSNFDFDCASPNYERLVVSQYDEIIGGEFTTLYFQRDGVWITPAFSGVSMDCVTRRYALEKGLCKEAVVSRSSLKEGDQCWLSDGVRGFCRGVIRFSTADHENDLLAFDTPKEHRPAPQRDTKSRLRNKLEYVHGETDEDGRDSMTDNKEKGDDKDESNHESKDKVTPIQAETPNRKHRSLKRPNPFTRHTSSPTSRRSKRGDPDFVPSFLADDDQVGSTGYKAIPNPEHKGVIHRQRLSRPYRPDLSYGRQKRSGQACSKTLLERLDLLPPKKLA